MSFIITSNKNNHYDDGQVRKEARRGEDGGSVGSTHAAVLEHITAVAGRSQHHHHFMIIMVLD